MNDIKIGDNVRLIHDTKYESMDVYSGSVGVVEGFGKFSEYPIVRFDYPDKVFNLCLPYDYLVAY